MLLKIFMLVITVTYVLSASSVGILEKKGAKIVSVMCDKAKLQKEHFSGIEDAKTKISAQKLCSPLTQKQLLAVATYLGSATQKENTPTAIKVPKDAKCPICGMFVAKYPKWVTLMEDSKNQMLYFDGVKDMMKYYFNHPQEKFHHIYAHDFYTLTPINAQKAYFVIGSNVYGPMGEELIPFSTPEDAKTFFQEHKGKKIIKFNEILEDSIPGYTIRH